MCNLRAHEHQHHESIVDTGTTKLLRRMEFLVVYLPTNNFNTKTEKLFNEKVGHLSSSTVYLAFAWKVRVSSYEGLSAGLVWSIRQLHVKYM